MVDITAWIQRVPLPYEFKWKIPLEAMWVHPYEEASPRGPIAFAVNGVPIFHYAPVCLLDECNALDQGDGTYAYYTTQDRPYTIGCHHAVVDEALRIVS